MGFPADMLSDFVVIVHSVWKKAYGFFNISFTLLNLFS